MRLGWFQGDVEDVNDALEDHMRRAQEGVLHVDMWEKTRSVTPDDPELRILLVPDDFDLTSWHGDDWNDSPAHCNAGPPYEETWPEGTVELRLRLGEPWPSALTPLLP